MMHAAALAGLFALTLSQPAADQTKSDLDNLKGPWKAESIQYNGVPVAADAIEKTRVMFDGNKVSIRDPKDAADFTLDPSQKPPAITIQPPPKPGVSKEGPILGIYQFEGDKLKLCLSQPGKPRPTEFASAKDGETVLFVLVRAK